MKYLYTLFLNLFLCVGLFGQDTLTEPPASFEIVVAFGSKGTGISSDEFLTGFNKKFSKKYKVKLSVFQLTGCGREGETKVLYSLKKIKPSLQKKIRAELKTTIDKENAKNYRLSPSNGDIVILFNQQLAAFSYCRGKLKKWPN